MISSEAYSILVVVSDYKGQAVSTQVLSFESRSDANQAVEAIEKKNTVLFKYDVTRLWRNTP